jgi:hypothetical protein
MSETTTAQDAMAEAMAAALGRAQEEFVKLTPRQRDEMFGADWQFSTGWTRLPPQYLYALAWLASPHLLDMRASLPASESPS